MKNTKHIQLKIFAFLTALTVMALAIPSRFALANETHDSYSFNYWGEEILQPYPYLYSETISQSQMGEKLLYPEDMCIYENRLYIADTGNSRVLICDMEGKIEKIITCAASEEDHLKEPYGVFVDHTGHLYIADSGNGRVVEYDENMSFLRTIGRPVTELIPDTQEYKPLKVVVDLSDRIYVTAYGINMGLVEFDKNGNFRGFMGAAEVSVSRFFYIWKNYFSTEAQQERMETVVPTEYSNIFVDDENFIYATIGNISSEDRKEGADAIRRLNPTGTDVLRRLANYDIVGDFVGGTDGSGFSSFADVAVTDYDCYFILDDANGKIFVYDYDGNSVFVFSKKGTRTGNLQKPTAIALSENEDRVYVLDKILNSIIVFEITEYGRNVLDAIRLGDTGDSEGADACWQKVLAANSNSEMAYIGLGKTYLSEGDYKKAMEYFELGNSRKYYNKAFYYYRKEVMEEYFPKAMTCIGILLVLIIAMVSYKKYKRWRSEVKCFMAKR